MTTRRLERGVTLIEMMVALLIGTILTVAVFVVMSTFEGRRRTIGSGTDLDQNASIAMFEFDQWIRGAGTGLSQAVILYTTKPPGPYAYGCELLAAKSGSQILPSGTLPAPFASVNPGAAGVFRLAPVMILPGQTTPAVSGSPSDVLVTMTSGSGNGQVPAFFDSLSPPTATQLNLVNSMAFSASSPSGTPAATNDLVLLVDRASASGPSTLPCMLTQVSSTYTDAAAAGTPPTAVTALPLGGSGTSWYAATVGTQSVTSYPLTTGAAIDLGNPASVRPPLFQLLGVGDNNTLYSYDLLNITGTVAQPRAEGVFEVHALYGVGTGPTTTFVAPSGSYSPSALSAGNSTSAGLIQGINAIRVGLILRTALREKLPVTGSTTLTLFPDLSTSGLSFSRPLSSEEQHYRYRTIEATIPMRNTF